MAEQDQEILLGRLAIHYKILSKEQAHQAIKLWKATQKGEDLGEFLVRESYISAETLPKLLRARTEYLRRKGQPEEPVAPVAAAPVAAAPLAAAPLAPTTPGAPLAGESPSSPVGAATVRLTPEMLAEAAVAMENPAPGMAVPGADAGPAGPLTGLPEPESAPPLTLPTPAAPPLELAPEVPAAASAMPGLVFAEPVVTDSPAAEPSAAEPLAAEAPTTAPAVAAPVVAAPAPAIQVEPQGPLGYAPGVALLDILHRACEMRASDVHVHSQAPLKIRMHGQLEDASPLIDREAARELIQGVLNEQQMALLEENLQLDFSFQIDGVGRFRANAYQQHRGLDATFRIIPPQPPTLKELGLPESLGRFAEFHQGMVLFTGPAGCGKSSTMAALVRMINESRPDHILTIEDPIEYVHQPRSCVVNQREVGPHTESFSRALRAALREDPDIIVIGEMRDLETIQQGLTAAETGHLVLGTLHTASSIPTVNRLVGVFPPDQQAQIRTMVSESLRGIVSQRLVVREDGRGRVPALEILLNNKAVGNLIRDSRTFQIKSVLQTGGSQGMCELDTSLADLVKEGVISKETARKEALEPKRFA